METETRTPARLLEGALNAAGIDGLAGTPDYVLLDRVLDTHQGRRLLQLANLGQQWSDLGAARLEDAAAYDAERACDDCALPDPEPATILEEAQGMVYGDRQADYGHPREDFTRTAIIWTGLLLPKLADGAHLEPEDVARCQIGVKLARDVHAPKRDNRVDMAGYALTLDRLETGR